MIIVILIVGLTLIMMLVSTFIINISRLKEIDQEILELEELQEPEEIKPEVKTHYTIEEAKEIDWKNVTFK